ncbi:MAG: hypothetical protein AVDCRST_MAG08-465 [uncultured Acetobacteraceae bacterium]|uniref:Uncharacterized protein n=1 Tax=uncultured Acetobacteraceae bacterium TaxID=169975 RepID=A0A6J4HA56_9PROT|nr:MAG: hypothetical protein AVDCRST_MAG08-465 [uncultured Acetobacteraceae bacterium]
MSVRSAAKRFELTMTDDETPEITGKPANGAGGLQGLIQSLQAHLNPGHRTFSFDDAELARLLRHMALYDEGGGFEGRLHRAFRRALRGCLGL